MPRIKEIIQIESVRQEKTEWNKIHLFKEGSFYHVFDWSAWLVSTVTYSEEVRKNTPDRKPITVTRRKLAEGIEYCVTGFPLNSITKFIPTFNPNSNNFTAVSDNHLCFEVELPKTEDGSEWTYEQLKALYDEWKNEIAFSTKSNKSEKPDVTVQSRNTLMGIWAEVLAYPIENKTPMENTQYLSNLKTQLASLL